MNNLEYIVDKESCENRIDKWICLQDTGLTRSAVQKLIEEGNITVNSKQINKNYVVKLHDIINLIIPEPVELDVVPQELPVEIIYQDNDLLVVNKPKGMVVHPAAGNPDKTLVNALLFHCKAQLSAINGVIRPGIVHRIDKDTSGLLIVAKNDFAHVHLAQQIKQHTFTREYQAVLCGRLKNQSGTIDAPVGRDKSNRKKMCVTDQNSKNAVTHYEILDIYRNNTLAKFNLETGRTHQIRVHSAYIGHPVYGDSVYGKAEKGVVGQCLHAKKIGFIHPRTNNYIEFDSDLPAYFREIINKFKNQQ